MQLNSKHGKKLTLLMKFTAPREKLLVPWMKLELIQVMRQDSLDLLLNNLVVPVELFKKMDGLLHHQLPRIIHLHMNQLQPIQPLTHQLHTTQPLAHQILDQTGETLILQAHHLLHQIEETLILQAHHLLDQIEETLILQAHHHLHQNGE